MINDKTFIISDNPIKLDSSWESFRLHSGKTLSFSGKLHVFANKDANAVLIGHAWQVEKGKPSPKESIENMAVDEKKENVYEIEKGWCGRYILIVGHTLFLDATGTMGCFYGDGKISNSINVLRQVVGEAWGG